jgi:ribosomal protein S18 acetylase RimI-like enzyme
MSSLLPDRLRRRREGRIGERAHRDGHKSRKYLFLDVEDSRATVRTEVEDALSTVRDAGVPPRNALDRHLLCVEKCLRSEDASASTLAGETVADRDPQRLALDREPELLAATRSASRAHRPILDRSAQVTFPHAGPGKSLPPGDTVVVERAVSRNTHPSPTGANDRVSVRTLAAPTRREIEALAEIFDQYRAHYGEDSDASRSACWLGENLSTSGLRVFVAEDNERFVGFAITMEVPASLRLAHFWQIRDLFVLPTHRRLGVGRALLASVRAAAIASGALRLVLQTEDDNDAALRLYADSGYAMIKGYCSLMLPLDP